MKRVTATAAIGLSIALGLGTAGAGAVTAAPASATETTIDTTTPPTTKATFGEIPGTVTAKMNNGLTEVSWSKATVPGVTSYRAYVAYIRADRSLVWYTKNLPKEVTKTALGPDAASWREQWMDPSKRFRKVSAFVFAVTDDDLLLYDDRDGVSVTPPAPQGYTPPTVKEQRNVTTGLHLSTMIVGADMYGRPNTVSVRTNLYGSRGTSDRELEYWWYPASGTAPTRVGAVTARLQDNGYNPDWEEAAYFNVPDAHLPTKEDGRIEIRYRATTDVQVTAWGERFTTTDTDAVASADVKVPPPTPSRIKKLDKQRAPHGVQRVGKITKHRIHVKATAEITKVQFFDGSKLLGDAKYRYGEWVYPYKVKPGKHKLRFKVITATDQKMAKPTVIIGR